MRSSNRFNTSSENIIGLLIEMAIVATEVSLALCILGVKYAFLLWLITGISNIIPYIGIFTSLIISSLITFATSAIATKVILVAIVFVFTHLAVSNKLLPVIVGSKVRINALITVLGVIIGEMIWGIPGCSYPFRLLPYSKLFLTGSKA